MNHAMRKRLERLERTRPTQANISASRALDLVRAFGTHKEYCAVCELIKVERRDPLSETIVYGWHSSEAQTKAVEIARKYVAIYGNGPNFSLLSDVDLNHAYELLTLSLPMSAEKHREYQAVCSAAYHHVVPPDAA